MRRLLLAVLLCLAPAAAAQAAEPPIVLDAERRAALAGLPSLHGAPQGELAGKVVVLTFFASWCPPCHAEFDHLNAIRAQHDPEKVAILAVNIFEDFLKTPPEETRRRLAGFLAQKDPAFSVLGRGEPIGPLFGDVQRIPTLFVFGADGRPLLHFVHARGATKTSATAAEIGAAIERGLRPET